MDNHLKELFELLAIPTISAQRRHDKDINRATEWLRDKLLKLNFKAEILPTKGHPVIYAEKLSTDKNSPTVLIYGHYDVQSPDPLAEWTSDPFKPEIRSGNIYARGSSDDKGQLYTWIAAVEDILASDKDLKTNVKFLIEGEEEVGSNNLDEFVEQNASLLQSDICVISDSHSLSQSQPLIDYGLRGLTYMEVTVKTLGKDVHSGIYGGNVLNPAIVLADIIAKLKDENHKILIPGFYDAVREIDAKERMEIQKQPFTDKDVLEETGAEVVVGEEGHSVQERAGARPTLDVNGIWGGYQDEGPKTIIPAEAGVKISMRLVPFQNSRAIAEKFESYVREITPKGAEVTIKTLSAGEPILMDRNSKYFRAAEVALEKVFGNKPLYTLSGGSIPVTAVFKQLLGIDSILMGYGLPDDGLHGPNEKMSLEMFEKGIEANKLFLTSL